MPLPPPPSKLRSQTLNLGMNGGLPHMDHLLIWFKLGIITIQQYHIPGN